MKIRKDIKTGMTNFLRISLLSFKNIKVRITIALRFAESRPDHTKEITFMKRHDWALHFLVAFGLLFIDQVTKSLANTSISGVNFWGPFGLVLHHNPGAMLGAFSDLPPILRVVSLSTGGAFLFFIYLAIQYLISRPAKLLRFGMSILLGGIMGNVVDRIFEGAVTDFLLLRAWGMTSPAFNVADMVQWIGYAMIVFSLIRDGNVFWPEKDSRKKVWVNADFQKKYILSALGLSMGFVLIMGVFFFTYLKITIDSLVIGAAPVVEKKFLTPFFITFSVIALGFFLMVFILSRILSHRVAGPLYAFEKFIEDLLKGKSKPLRLRQGDEFKHLEELADKLRDKFEPKEPNP